MRVAGCPSGMKPWFLLLLFGPECYSSRLCEGRSQYQNRWRVKPHANRHYP
jgi:hypothetical protein